MKKIIFVLSFVLLASCGGGGSDGGGMVTPTLPGTNIPASFAGVYTGTLTVTAEAVGVTETDTFPITITVTQDAMVRFDGDEPDETFTVGLTDAGAFSGNLSVNESDCSGTVGVTGSLDGTNASGTVSGSGRCRVSGVNIDVELDGDFSANK